MSTSAAAVRARRRRLARGRAPRQRGHAGSASTTTSPTPTRRTPILHRRASRRPRHMGPGDVGGDGRWRASSWRSCVLSTPTTLQWVGRFLPFLYFPDNLAGDTAAVDWPRDGQVPRDGDDGLDHDMDPPRDPAASDDLDVSLAARVHDPCGCWPGSGSSASSAGTTRAAPSVSSCGRRRPSRPLPRRRRRRGCGDRAARRYDGRGRSAEGHRRGRTARRQRRAARLAVKAGAHFLRMLAAAGLGQHRRAFVAASPPGRQRRAEHDAGGQPVPRAGGPARARRLCAGRGDAAMPATGLPATRRSAQRRRGRRSWQRSTVAAGGSDRRADRRPPRTPGCRERLEHAFADAADGQRRRTGPCRRRVLVGSARLA